MLSSTTPLSEGTKHDQDKPRWDLLSIPAILELVKVLTFGAVKYASWNWAKGIKFSRVYAAAQRHMTTWFSGEDNDSETGLSHLAHAMCCMMFLLTFQLFHGRYAAFDDRAEQPWLEDTGEKQALPFGYAAVYDQLRGQPTFHGDRDV